MLLTGWGAERSERAAVDSDGLLDLHLEAIKLGNVVGLRGGGDEGDQGEGEAVDGALQADQGLADGFGVGDHGQESVLADDGGQQDLVHMHERLERIHHQLRIRHRELLPGRILLQHAGGLGDAVHNVLEPRGHPESLNPPILQGDPAHHHIQIVRHRGHRVEHAHNCHSVRGVGRLAAHCQRQHQHEHSP